MDDEVERSGPRRAERSAGAFLGPDLLVPAPMRTLSDAYHDERTEPVDSDRVPAPDPPGAVRRLIASLRRRLGGGDPT